MLKLKVGADSVTPSTPSALFDLAEDAAGLFGSPFAVGPDGRRFLVRVPADKGAQPLEVILNWPALLEKGSGAE